MRSIKKIVTILICCLVMLSNMSIGKASTDNKGPEVLSISIDKHEVTVGDTITITMELSDESGISNEFLYCPTIRFRNVENGTTKEIYCDKMVEEGTFQGSYTVTEESVDGNYTFYSATVYDTLKNQYNLLIKDD